MGETSHAPAMSSPRSHVYIGTFAHTPTPSAIQILHDTAVAVLPTGIIAFTAALPPSDPISAILSSHGWTDPSSYVLHDLRSSQTTRFFFPGFIDTHTHASQYPNAGIFGNSTLLDWLETYTFPLESSFSDLAKARHVYRRAVQRSLSHGTTCAAYYATVHVAATNLLADVCLAAGQRALVGRVCMDRMSPAHYQDASPAAALAATEACAAHCLAIDPAQHTVRPVITPRFAPSCTDATLGALGALAASTDWPVQTHVAENPGEVALVRELFPRARDYVDVYAAAGLLTPRTILAHGVHFSDAEVAAIAAGGAGVSHCPASNTALTSGACNVRRLLDGGVAVGLGTDVSGGFSSSVLEMVRQAMLVSRHVAMAEGARCKLDLSEALYLATRGGAGMVGLEGKAGAFAAGMYFDAQLIQLQDYKYEGGEEGASVGGDEAVEGVRPTVRPCDVFGWESWEDRIAKWAWGGDDRNVVSVWVGGRQVYHEP